MAEIRIDGARCPYCHDHLGDPRERVACAACGARAHLACHQEHPACATCGGTEILVPRGTAAAAQQPAEPLPAHTRLELLREPDALEISWPAIPPTQRVPVLLFAVLSIPLFGLGLFVLWWTYRHWTTRVRCRLTHEALELNQPWTLSDPSQVRCRRIDVQMVERQGSSSVALRTQDDRRSIASAAGLGTLVTLGDVGWLAETLHAWNQGRLAFSSASAEAAPPASPRADPKRDPKQLERG